MAATDPAAIGGSTAHLRAAAIATALGGLLVALSVLLATRVIETSPPAWRRSVWASRARGLILPQRLLTTPTAVALFGSSELTRDQAHRPDRFFATAPTGFTIVPIGSAGMLLAEEALAIAALRRPLHGRSVVLALSPLEFTLPDSSQRQTYFDGNYSRLHAAAVLGDDALPASLRRGIARRLIAYPRAMSTDPVVTGVARGLLATTPAFRIAAGAARPLLALDRAWLAYTDLVRSALEVHAHARDPDASEAIPTPIAWDSLETDARQQYASRSAGNPFGVDSTWWRKVRTRLMNRNAVASNDEVSHALESGPAWSELELALDALAAAGAHPLLLSLPFHGRYYDYAGIPMATRAVYYDRLREIAAHHGVPLASYRDHDLDSLFLRDEISHPSPVGWLAADRDIDAFVRRSAR